MSQEKLQTMIMENFGRVKEVYDWICVTSEVDLVATNHLVQKSTNAIAGIKPFSSNALLNAV